MSDLRWQQRFDNFEKAILRLKDAIKIVNPSIIEQAGIIQTFEFTFELGWKTLKDYLENEGFTVSSPRKAIKQGFQSEIILDGEVWLDALEKRNLMAQTYDEKCASTAIELINKKFYPSLESFYTKNKIER
jgi:nucleotidyltransferase substrate binding protein (TIGR01987 family)